jgi:hypothetical protein
MMQADVIAVSTSNTSARARLYQPMAGVNAVGDFALLLPYAGAAAADAAALEDAARALAAAVADHDPRGISHWAKQTGRCDHQAPILCPAHARTRVLRPLSGTGCWT